jgi:Tfp pilus assembly protein PilN
MSDLEFLPRWYPEFRRRRRLLILQAGLLLTLGTSLCALLIVMRASAQYRQQQKIQLDQQLDKTQADLNELASLLRTRRQLRMQLETQAKIGMNVEVSRILAELENAVPREMALRSVSLDTVEQTRSPEADPASDGRTSANDRLLKVRLTGIAPSDADVSSLITSLNRIPFFQQVTPVETHDHVDRGHLAREFELTFCVSLNAPDVNEAQGQN